MTSVLVSVLPFGGMFIIPGMETEMERNELTENTHACATVGSEDFECFTPVK